MPWQVIMPRYTGFNEKSKVTLAGYLKILSIVISEISVLYQRIKQTNQIMYIQFDNVHYKDTILSQCKYC